MNERVNVLYQVEDERLLVRQSSFWGSWGWQITVLVMGFFGGLLSLFIRRRIAESPLKLLTKKL